MCLFGQGNIIFQAGKIQGNVSECFENTSMGAEREGRL